MIIRRTSLPILTEEANREGEPERGHLEGCWLEAEVKCLTEEELSDFRKL
jgi:hypothetical protein